MDEVIMLNGGGDTALPENKCTHNMKSSLSEENEEASCVRESTAASTELDISNVQPEADMVPADANMAKSGREAEDGSWETVGVLKAEEGGGQTEAATTVEEPVVPGQQASPVRALLSLTGKGALALVAADILVGRPLQLIANDTARFWAVGLIVGVVFFLVAASIGHKWRTQVNIQTSEVVTGSCPQEQQMCCVKGEAVSTLLDKNEEQHLVMQIPHKRQQTAEAPFPAKTENSLKQSLCEDTVTYKSSDNSSKLHFVRNLNDNALVL